MSEGREKRKGGLTPSPWQIFWNGCQERAPTRRDHPKILAADKVQSPKLRIAEALKRLDQKHADIIYLRYYFAYSVEEISQVYGISRSRVLKIMKTARNALKKILSS
ncbi:MAG: sigma factor-like helix-turn-helix DNA-binding protein [Acidobacteriota bacterium]